MFCCDTLNIYIYVSVSTEALLLKAVQEATEDYTHNLGHVDEEVYDFLKKIGLSEKDEEIIVDEVEAEMDSAMSGVEAEQDEEDEAAADLDELEEAGEELTEATDVVAEAADAELQEIDDEMAGNDE